MLLIVSEIRSDENRIGEGVIAIVGTGRWSAK